jgi:hypothetical protein
MRQAELFVAMLARVLAEPWLANILTFPLRMFR